MMSNQSSKTPQRLEETIQTDVVEDTAYDPTARPSWELIVEIGAQVPDEEWAKVPRDFARNTEHYMYGAAKEP